MNYRIKIRYNKKNEIVFCESNNKFYAYQIRQMLIKDGAKSEQVIIEDKKLKAEIKFY